MNERKTISKKMRFEVFKRDSFTCQYCGKMAPDVVLEVDHINAVANGGKNEIMNLVTSCFDCNRGKGKNKLSDKKEIEIQQEQLKLLNEKREQLKLMLEWKKELLNFENEQIEKAEEVLEDLTGMTLSEHGKNNFKKWIKTFGLMEIIECIEISAAQYFKEEIKETHEKTINYIPKIASNRIRQKNDPLLKEKNQIKYALKNRISYVNYNRLTQVLNLIRDKQDAEEIKEIAYSCRHWTDFIDQVDLVFGRS